MPTAKENEVTIVQIEGEGYNKAKIVVPICAMKAGIDHQTYVDLLVPCPAKLSLLQGEGPTHLIGSHCVDFYGYRDTGAGDDTEDDDEETAEEKMEDKEAEELAEDATKKTAGASGDKVEKKTTPIKDDSKNRKASTEQAKSQEKK